MVQYRNVGARSVVDPVCGDVAVSRAPFAIVTNGSGSTTGRFGLSSQKILGVTTAGVAATIEPAHLPWLTNTSGNFLQYRVSRATLVVVGNAGSTTSGQIAIISSPDYVDIAVASVSFGDLVTGGTMFPLSDLASNNKRVPLRIDSSWKKVSAVSSNLSGTTIVPNATVDDLIFTGFQYSVAGGPASTSVVSFFVEYDIEFQGVAGAGFNV